MDKFKVIRQGEGFVVYVDGDVTPKNLKDLAKEFKKKGGTTE